MYNRQLDHYGDHNALYIAMLWFNFLVKKKYHELKKILDFLKFDIHAICSLSIWNS